MATQLVELLTLAGARVKRKSANARTGQEVQFLRSLIDIFMAAPEKFHGAALDEFDGLVCALCANADPETRQAIGARLAHSADAPRRVLKQLARDDISIAESILRLSPNLKDDDICAIIRARGIAHHRAIANRFDLSYAVSEALLALNNEVITISLLKNQRAHFRPHVLEALVDQSRKLTSLQAPLVNRFDLSPALLTRLYFYVPAALKSQILNRSDHLEPALIDEAIQINRASLFHPGQDKEHLRHSVYQRSIQGHLTEVQLRALISERKLDEFIFAFAYLAGLDEDAVKTILNDSRFEALAIACRASEIHRDLFSRLVFGVLLEGRDKAKALRILDLYLKVPPDAAKKLMRLWRLRSKAVQNANQTIILDAKATATRRSNKRQTA